MKPKVEVRDSPIHGKGVFATRRLRRGSLVGVYVGEPTTENDTYVLWIEGDDGKLFGIDGRNELRFLNHSRSANAMFYGEELFATRDIAPGSEITFDYGDEWADAE